MFTSVWSIFKNKMINMDRKEDHKDIIVGVTPLKRFINYY